MSSADSHTPGREAFGGSALALHRVFLFLTAVLLAGLVLPILLFLPDVSGAELGRQLGEPGLLRAVAVSLSSATLATAVMALLGVPLGYLLARDALPVPNLVRILVLLPMVLPPVAAGVLLLDLYGPAGWIGRWMEGSGWTLVNAYGGILLAQVFVAAPFVVVSAEAAFRTVDPTLEAAAATLGRTRGQIFRRVSLPLARYGILAGLSLAWMRAAGEFGATMVMAYHPHSLPVYLWVKLTGRGLAAALPIVLVALALATLVLLFARWTLSRGWERSGRRPVLRGPAVPAGDGEEGSDRAPVRMPGRRAPAAGVPAAAGESRVRTRGATAAGDPVLEVEVRHRQGEFLLEGRLAIGEEILSLFGPSGAGKSTLLRAVAGLVRPDAGRVAVAGSVLFRSVPPAEWVPVHRRPVGLVFQRHALFPHLSVLENILFGAPGRLPDARELLAMTRLSGLEGRYPEELSGGQQQRVALARALIRRPKVLLLDEPFSSLDTNMKERLQLDVLRLQRALRLGVIYVTHDLEDACSLGDRLAVIGDGRILQVGEPLDVIRRPETHDVARFVGVRNLLAGEVVGRSGDLLEVRVGGLTLEAALPAGGAPPPGPVELCVRPEDIVLLKPDRPLRPPADENVLSGRVVERLLRGGSYRLLFAVGAPESPALRLEIELPVRSYEALRLESHDEWSISIRRGALHVLPLSG